MNVTCTSCSARYAIPDEKVQGRKVRIKCKKCANPIIVDGTLQSGASPEAAPTPNADVKRAAQQTILGGLQAPAIAVAAPKTGEAKNPIVGGLTPALGATPFTPQPSPLTPSPGGAKPNEKRKAAATMIGGMSPAAGSAPAPTALAAQAPRAAATKVEPEADPWTVAVTEEDQRDVTTAGVVDLYAAGTIDSETFVWREGMDDWLSPWDIPEIAKALRARGLKRPVDDSPIEPPPPSSGRWHEPGSWEPPKVGALDDEIGFDDVTKAMSIDEAERLAREEYAGSTASTSADDRERTDATASPLAPRASSPVPPAPRAAPLPKAPATAPVEPVERKPARPPAARRDESRAKASVDLFGAEAPPPDASADPHHYTGERHETSVLFSLDALTKVHEPEPPKAKPKAADLDFLTSSDSAPDSLAAIGGGVLAVPRIQAPDFTAPAAPPPPEPRRAEYEALSAPPPAPFASSNKWILLLAALVLIAVGGGAFAYVNWPKPPNGAATTSTAAATPTAPAAEPPTAAPEPTAVAPTAEATPAQAPSANAEPSTNVEPSAKALAVPPPPSGAKPASSAPPVGAPPVASAEGEPPPPAAPTDLPPFNKAAASAALGAAAGSAAGCKKPDGPTGSGKAVVTFMPSGRATNAVVSGDFAGTAVGGCVARIFRSATVPPFSGDPVTVGKSFSIQ